MNYECEVNVFYSSYMNILLLFFSFVFYGKEQQSFLSDTHTFVITEMGYLQHIREIIFHVLGSIISTLQKN